MALFSKRLSLLNYNILWIESLIFQSNHASSLNQFCPSYISFDSSLPMERVQQSFNFLKDYGSYYLLLRMFIRTTAWKVSKYRVFSGPNTGVSMKIEFYLHWVCLILQKIQPQLLLLYNLQNVWTFYLFGDWWMTLYSLPEENRAFFACYTKHNILVLCWIVVSSISRKFLFLSKSIIAFFFFFCSSGPICKIPWLLVTIWYMLGSALCSMICYYLWHLICLGRLFWPY